MSLALLPVSNAWWSQCVELLPSLGDLREWVSALAGVEAAGSLLFTVLLILQILWQCCGCRRRLTAVPTPVRVVVREAATQTEDSVEVIEPVPVASSRASTPIKKAEPLLEGPARRVSRSDSDGRPRPR